MLNKATGKTHMGFQSDALQIPGLGIITCCYNFPQKLIHSDNWIVSCVLIEAYF